LTLTVTDEEDIHDISDSAIVGSDPVTSMTAFQGYFNVITMTAYDELCLSCTGSKIKTCWHQQQKCF